MDHAAAPSPLSGAAPRVAVVGGGLAGCECAATLARAGLRVRLYEMRPERTTGAHNTDRLAELVCSNSFRAASWTNAVGLIKEEMRRLGSLVMQQGDRARVPAGGAHAVDRELFAAGMTRAMLEHPGVDVVRRPVERLDEPELRAMDAVIVATGPLTDGALAQDLAGRTGRDRLYFYDAIAPVVEADSIDEQVVFRASRYGKGEGDDYLNCAFDEAGYHAFIDALLGAGLTPLHGPDEARFFPGCQPIEEIARQGRMAPAFGPMKPVGLRDPRTGRRPFAVVQLRAENLAGTAYNLVGFQTRLRHPEQERVFRTIPGLEQAVFLRLGSVHRNTFLDSPRVLDDRLRLPADPRIRFAGQITGVEGYVESTACGLLQGLWTAAELLGRPLAPPPPVTALGSMLAHLRNTHSGAFQPSNIHWGHFPPLEQALPRGRNGRPERRAALAERALEALEGWRAELAGWLPLPPAGLQGAPGVADDPALEPAGSRRPHP